MQLRVNRAVIFIVLLMFLHRLMRRLGGSGFDGVFAGVLEIVEMLERSRAEHEKDKSEEDGRKTPHLRHI